MNRHVCRKMPMFVKKKVLIMFPDIGYLRTSDFYLFWSFTEDNSAEVSQSSLSTLTISPKGKGLSLI